jgi:hypothetical protein
VAVVVCVAVMVCVTVEAKGTKRHSDGEVWYKCGIQVPEHKSNARATKVKVKNHTHAEMASSGSWMLMYASPRRRYVCPVGLRSTSSL